MIGENYQNTKRENNDDKKHNVTETYKTLF